jgi:hypothetical protein
MYNFVHLENISTIFTYSYLGSIHLGGMYNFVHLAEMAMRAKMYTIFVTYMLVMCFYLAHHYLKISSHPIFSLFTHPTMPPMPQHTSQHTPHNHLPPPPPTPPNLPLHPSSSSPAAAVKMTSASEVFDNNICGDKDAHVPNFVDMAGDIQNWVSCCARMVMTEEQRY